MANDDEVSQEVEQQRFIKEQKRTLELMNRLNKNSDFIEFRERGIKPELIKLEITLLNSDKLSEVDVRTNLKLYQKLKEMFHTWFENTEEESKKM